MDVEKMCITFNQAVKLWELGIKEESVFVWTKAVLFNGEGNRVGFVPGIMREVPQGDFDWEFVTELPIECTGPENEVETEGELYPAYLSDELWEMLPRNSQFTGAWNKDNNFCFRTTFYGNYRGVNPAWALGDALIGLIEQQIVKPGAL